MSTLLGTTDSFVSSPIMRAFEASKIEYATAIVWIKGQSNAIDRERLISHIMSEPAVVDVFFSHSKANLLNIEFRYDRIRYDGLLKHVREAQPNASIVGF